MCERPSTDAPCRGDRRLFVQMEFTSSEAKLTVRKGILSDYRDDPQGSLARGAREMTKFKGALVVTLVQIVHHHY